ncbi:MAG: anthranilate phosphoribosyltransferase [Parasporobacterium sp.]|nr:anthranilate phosphoribosyltransferase [Parasporobacterium sp.]
MIGKAIEKIVDKKDLTFDEAYNVMDEVLGQRASQIQSAALLAAISTKKAGDGSVEEISGCVSAMRRHSLTVEHDLDVLEIVGTGGDGSSSFNISTTSAFVAAAAGINVAKHGDRAASSKSGTADCLEALGAQISLDPEKCIELLEDTGFCFFFAQKYHQQIEALEEIRKELGVRNALRLISTLANPANPTHYLLGVYDEYLVEPMAKVLIRLGVKKGLVVYGRDKLDEISLSAATAVCEIRDGYYRSYVIRPEDFGFRRCSKEQLVGGTPEVNAAITRAVLDGSEKGPQRRTVLLNSGAAIYAAGKADSIKDGIEIAQNCIDSKEALRRMEEFIRQSRE